MYPSPSFSKGFIGTLKKLKILILENRLTGEDEDDEKRIKAAALGVHILIAYKTHLWERNQQLSTSELKAEAYILRGLSKVLRKAAKEIASYIREMADLNENHINQAWNQEPLKSIPSRRLSRKIGDELTGYLEPHSESNLKITAEMLEGMVDICNEHAKKVNPGFDKESGRKSAKALGRLWDSLRGIGDEVPGQGRAKFAYKALRILTKDFMNLPELDASIKRLKAKSEKKGLNFNFGSEDVRKSLQKSLTQMANDNR